MRSTAILFTSVLSVLSAIAVNAAPIEMRVLPAIDAQNPGNLCPEKVTLTETSRPYREGGYTIDGSANLSSIAEKMTIATTDDFSVTWIGTLKPKYSKCKATASMARIEGEAYQGHSYLRLRFVKGKVYLILDMTGKNDANDFTTVILQRSVRNGNPSWTWGGTD
ncbi:hypothetical protein ACQ4M3_14695 [Leptolyngbya sp. AN03gr2]|uniref:hypothetical protein n=1 Tax=unclassified Leptolyngbya TaxID=2650499 RepID=UPI003D31FA1B